jgi:ribosomal-protein-alanine N-acetyltransferase
MKFTAKSFRTYIQKPDPDDEKAFLTAMQNSAGLHHPWVSAPNNRAAWKRYLKRIDQDTEAGFLVKRKLDHAICGVVNFNIITYEALCSSYISYFGVEGFADQGYMKEGLSLAVRYAFSQLGLHRLEANIQPENHASIALAKTVGFRLEGFSPRYLRIKGEWRDHERWAILADSEDFVEQ